MILDLIAEAGQTMEGDVGLAVEMVHAFADAGATGFKVQLLDPEKIATADAESYWRTGPPILQRQSFADSGLIPYGAWGPVRAACAQRQIAFVGTPFDHDAVRALVGLDADAIKVASGDITFWPLLHHIRDAGKRVYFSTGASTPAEIVVASTFFGNSIEKIPLACTLSYPTPMNRAMLGRIGALRRLDLLGVDRIGYSDHTESTYTAGHAVLAGATVLEKHVTMRKGSWRVPDHAMALDPVEFSWYCASALSALELLGGDGLRVGEQEQAARVGARRAARWTHDFGAGHTLGSSDDVSVLRPDPDGSGDSIRMMLRHTGHKLVRSVLAGELIAEEQFVREH